MNMYVDTTTGVLLSGRREFDILKASDGKSILVRLGMDNNGIHVVTEREGNVFAADAINGKGRDLVKGRGGMRWIEVLDGVGPGPHWRIRYFENSRRQMKFCRK